MATHIGDFSGTGLKDKDPFKERGCCVVFTFVRLKPFNGSDGTETFILTVSRKRHQHECNIREKPGGSISESLDFSCCYFEINTFSLLPFILF